MTRKLSSIIHGQTPNNKLKHVRKQAHAENEIMYTFFIKNSVLLNIAKKPDKNDIETINNLIPHSVIRITIESTRSYERVRVLTWRIKEKARKLNRSDSTSKQDGLLEKFSSMSLLVSDAMMALEYEKDREKLEKEASDLNASIENW